MQSVNEFIKKLRRTAICDKFFQKNNLNFCGLRELFNKLFEVLRCELQKDELLGNDDEIDLNMMEISNFVMYNLHSEFFYNPEQSSEEKKFKRKMDVLDKLQPSAFGLEIDETMKHSLKMAFKEASQI